MIPLATLQAEAARELELRQRTFPARSASGNLLESDAAAMIAMASAWVADLARLAAYPVGRLPAPGHGLSWRERHAALVREMDLRTRHYPRYVEEGRLLAADAETRIARLAGIIAAYEDGPLYESRTGALPLPPSHSGCTPEQADAHLDWLEMQRDRAILRGDQERARWMADALRAETGLDTHGERDSHRHAHTTAAS